MGKQLDILVVDDSRHAVDYLSLKLESLMPEGFHLCLQSANNAEEGINLCRTKQFDLIFLDVEMPGMNGYEACEQIRAITPARIAMLTGKSMAEDFRKGTQAGCNHYLVKPPNESDLKIILSLTSMKKY